jgi:hypothetical protein
MTSASVTTTFTVDMLSKPSAFQEEDLIDSIADIRGIIKTLEKREKVLSEAFKSRHKNFDWVKPDQVEPFSITGHKYICTPIMVVQHRLDTEGLRAEFGDSWMEEHSKTIQFIQLRFPKAEEN